MPRTMFKGGRAAAVLAMLAGGGIYAVHGVAGEPNGTPAKEGVHSAALDTLASTGAKNPPELAALISQLRDPASKIRAAAAEAIAELGPSAGSAGPNLAALLTDPSVQVRRAAARAVHATRADAVAVLPALVKAVEDTDPVVRASAMEALNEIGKAAVPSLTQSLRNTRTAYWACMALGEIGADAAPAVPGLTELLAKDRRPEVRREAALALGAVGPAAAAAVPRLSEALDDTDPGVRMGAVFAIGRIGPAARGAKTRLERLLQGGPLPLLRALTAWALARIQPDDRHAVQRAVALLVESMWSQEPRVRTTAARGLADLHPPSELVLPAMVQILDQGPRELHTDVLRVLQDLGAAGVPALIHALDRPNAEVRRGACFALGRIGTPANAAKAPLQRQLDEADPATSLAAAWALARIDPDCSEAAPKSVPLLIRALGDSDPRVRLEAATSLRCLGPQARAAAAALRNVVVQDPNVLVRELAAEALHAVEQP